MRQHLTAQAQNNTSSESNGILGGPRMTNVQPEQLDLLAAPPPPGSYSGVDQAEENVEPGWWEMAWAELEACAISGSEFSADDLRDRVGEPDHPNRWGALFRSARSAGLIEVVAVKPSVTKSRHGGMLRVWKGAH